MQILFSPQACLQAVEAMCSGEVSFDSLLQLCNHTDGVHGQLYPQLSRYLTPMRDNPMVPLLTFQAPPLRSLEELFAEMELEQSAEATARLLQAILTAQVAPTFHKINVHAAMTPSEIRKLFEPVFRQAQLLQQTYQHKMHRLKAAQESLRTPDSLSRRRDSATSRRSALGSGSSLSGPEPEMTPFVTVSGCAVCHLACDLSHDLS